ncbi:MAG: type IX secretion system membrane protein PorP/SprF [Marinilabiliaceae bacterium]|nr:type IX secretion system membrane protein PorP/SprF [Marinilabiliaceae bacterium]
MFFILGSTLFIANNNICAQRYAIYNYYFHDNFLMNPAAAGYNKLCTDIKAFHRMQWFGMEDAPTTQLLSFQTGISGNFAEGTYIYKDKNGSQDEFGLHQAFSYEIFFSKTQKTNFSMTFGLGASVNQHRIDETGFFGGDLTDPGITGGVESGWGYNLSTGLLFKFNFISLGMSVANLLDQNNPLYDAYNEPGLPTVYHFHLGAHFKHPNRELYWEPSIMYRESEKYDNRFDINVKGMVPSPLSENVWFWGAINYRRTMDYKFGKNLAIAATVGAAIRRLYAGLEYQFGLTNAQSQFGSAYQIVVGYKICKRDYGGIPCSERDYIMNLGENNKYKSKRKR